MNRNIIDLLEWKLNEECFVDETGFPFATITLTFSSINANETILKTHSVLALSEHYIIADKFAIKRESWANKSDKSWSYMNFHEVVEMLENKNK